MSFLESLKYRDQLLWVRFTTPLAVEPDEAFREKTLRILTAIHIFIALAMPLYTLIRFGRWHWLHPVVMLALLAGALLCIHRRRLIPAAWLLLSAGYWVGFGSFLLNGIWALSFSSTHMFLIWGGPLILAPRNARWLPYIVLLLYGIMLTLQLVLHSPEAPATTVSGAIGSMGSIVVTVFIFWKGINYLMQEFHRQRSQLLTLIDTLEERVRTRTNDLEAAVLVSRDVATELTMDAVMQNITSVTRSAYHLSGVAIYQYEPEQAGLIYATGSGETFPYGAAETARIALNHVGCEVAQVARERKPCVLNVSQAKRLSDGTVGPSANQEMLLLPLLTQTGELIGVFILMSVEPDYFVPDKVTVFTLLANHLAGSMKNAQLYAKQLEANERLKTFDSVKSRFLANISHELKTPLSISLNFVEFVIEGLYGPISEKQREALTTAHRNGEQLLEFINDLLNLSRIESGQPLRYERNVDLGAELADLRPKVISLLKDKPVQFVEDIDPDLPLITCDRRGVQHILLNLLGNAVKFTDAGTITLSVKRTPSGILLVVSDTGPGIAPEDQATIFEPFKQTGAGQQQGGSGLGLPIVRGLVEAHGGQITLQSEPGQGTDIYVTLPGEPSVMIG
jgi:signal transduction histidine kinase